MIIFILSSNQVFDDLTNKDLEMVHIFYSFLHTVQGNIYLQLVHYLFAVPLLLIPFVFIMVVFGMNYVSFCI